MKKRELVYIVLIIALSLGLKHYYQEYRFLVDNRIFACSDYVADK